MLTLESFYSDFDCFEYDWGPVLDFSFVQFILQTKHDAPEEVHVYMYIHTCEVDIVKCIRFILYINSFCSSFSKPAGRRLNEPPPQNA